METGEKGQERTDQIYNTIKKEKGGFMMGQINDKDIMGEEGFDPVARIENDLFDAQIMAINNDNLVSNTVTVEKPDI